MEQFDRQYKFSAGKGGGIGFEIGETSASQPHSLHIQFSVEKADTETENTAKITIWNLSPQHLAELNRTDCVVVLKAGYGNKIPLIFTGAVSHITTQIDGADVQTEIEAIDGRIEIRDTYVSVSYSETISTKKIVQNIASDMGVTLIIANNASFPTLPNGFFYVGAAKGGLDKVCTSAGLDWSIQNGVLQIKKKGGTITDLVYVLSPETGLLEKPIEITEAADNESDAVKKGWEVKCFLNGSIGIGDYVRLESKFAKGYFRVYSISHDGDNLSGDWISTVKLYEQ